MAARMASSAAEPRSGASAMNWSMGRIHSEPSALAPGRASLRVLLSPSLPSLLLAEPSTAASPARDWSMASAFQCSVAPESRSDRAVSQSADGSCETSPVPPAERDAGPWEGASDSSREPAPRDVPARAGLAGSQFAAAEEASCRGLAPSPKRARSISGTLEYCCTGRDDNQGDERSPATAAASAPASRDGVGPPLLRMSMCADGTAASGPPPAAAGSMDSRTWSSSSSRERELAAVASAAPHSQMRSRCRARDRSAPLAARLGRVVNHGGSLDISWLPLGASGSVRPDAAPTVAASSTSTTETLSSHPDRGASARPWSAARTSAGGSATAKSCTS
mmetsp:Transcript_2438/g.9618  ORF Transcript_2438/g.9618 Transcript_2438/m.9618 type:complete len:336 (+) Transcript_2438:2194-3201(+)